MAVEKKTRKLETHKKATQRKRKPINLDTIIEAALRLLDQAGMEGVTTRALAERLGIQSPSLYWHVKNKQVLFSHMAEAMFMANLPPPAGPDQDWRDWLLDGARCIRNAALSRRDGARVIAASRPTGTIDTLSFPAMLQRLEEAGFSQQQALNAFLVLNRFSIGWALAEQMEGGVPHEVDQEAGYEQGLRMILTGLEQTLDG